MRAAGPRPPRDDSRGRLRTYLLVAFLARLADEGMGVAVVLLALHRTGSAADGAFVLTAWMAPHVVAAPLAGALVARARRPGRYYVLALGGFAIAITILAVGLGRAPLPLTLAVAVAGGACGPMVSGGLSSLVADIVSVEERSRAYGLDASVYNAASVAGPALVSVLAVAHTASTAVAALGCAAGIAALCATSLTGRLTPSAESTCRPTALRRELIAGLRTLVRVPELRAITASTTLALVGIGGLGATAVLLAGSRGSAGAGGVLMTAYALGSLAGSLAVARWWYAVAAPQLAAGCLFVHGLAFTAAALTEWWALCVALFTVAGLANGPLLGATFRIRADHSTPELRTQVFTTAAGLKISAAACGAALTGLAADRFTPTTLLLCLAGTQLAAVPVQLLLRRPSTRTRRPTSAGADP